MLVRVLADNACMVFGRECLWGCWQRMSVGVGKQCLWGYNACGGIKRECLLGYEQKMPVGLLTENACGGVGRECLWWGWQKISVGVLVKNACGGSPCTVWWPKGKKEWKWTSVLDWETTEGGLWLTSSERCPQKQSWWRYLVQVSTKTVLMTLSCPGVHKDSPDDVILSNHHLQAVRVVWQHSKAVNAAGGQVVALPDSHSEHHFPAPSSKLCQIWLRHWKGGGTLYLRAAVHRRGRG